MTARLLAIQPIKQFCVYMIITASIYGLVPLFVCKQFPNSQYFKNNIKGEGGGGGGRWVQLGWGGGMGRKGIQL